MTLTTDSPMAAVKSHADAHRAAVLLAAKNYIDLGLRIIPLDQGVSVFDGSPLGKGHGTKPLGKLAPHGSKNARKCVVICSARGSGILMIGLDGSAGGPL